MSSPTLNIYQWIRIQSISNAFYTMGKPFFRIGGFPCLFAFDNRPNVTKKMMSHLEGTTRVVYPIPLMESLPNETLTTNHPSFILEL